MKMKNHFYTGIISTVILTVFILGCVKTPSNALPLPDFKAKIRIIHAASEVAQTAVLMDGQSKATLNLGEGSAYITIDAGNRIFKLQDQTAETLFVDTDFSGTVYVADKVAASGKRFVKEREHWLYSTPIPDTMATVIIAQMVKDTLSTSITGVAQAWKGPDAQGRRFYAVQIPAAGSKTITIKAGADILTTLTETLQGKSSTTFVLCGSKTSLTVKKFANE